MTYSYDLANKKRDLTDTLSGVIAMEPRFISNFTVKSAATNPKHEWLEDQLKGRQTSVSANSSGVATVADISIFMVGTTFVVADDTAQFKVTAVDTSTSKITYALANALFSTKTALAVGDTVKVIASPMLEGSGNGDGESSYHQTGTAYNYTQIFRKEIVITGTALNTDVYGVDNTINRQTAISLGDITRQLNLVVLFGNRVEGDATTPSQAGGLLYYMSQNTSALTVDADGDYVDSIIVNNAAQLILAEGGTPNQILCSPGQARVLSNEYGDRLTILRADEQRGAYVAVVVNEINGSTMQIMADPDCPDGLVFVLDTEAFGMSPLQGRGITDEDATNKGFDGIKRLVLGEVTFEFKNIAQRACMITNIMGSTEALATIKEAKTTPYVVNNVVES